MQICCTDNNEEVAVCPNDKSLILFEQLRI